MNINMRNFFLDLSLSLWAGETEVRTNKWDYIKLKTFCTTRETISKMKRQSPIWENVFGNYVSIKLTSKIHKELKCLNTQQIIQLKNGWRT